MINLVKLLAQFFKIPKESGNVMMLGYFVGTYFDLNWERLKAEPTIELTGEVLAANEQATHSLETKPTNRFSSDWN